jgi:hypothetical protein
MQQAAKREGDREAHLGTGQRGQKLDDPQIQGERVTKNM